MTVTPALWAVTVLALVAVIAVDFWVVERREHPFTTREAGRWVVLYATLAALFAVFLLVAMGPEPAGQFVAGYLTEYSLSVDNLFVFVVLMASFAVPADLRHRVLLIGVVLALVLRTVMIFIGAAALSRFTVTFIIFGVFLLWTAWKVGTSDDMEPDPEGNAIVRLVERRLPVTREYHGHRWTVVLDGRRHVTPMLLVILAIGTTDLVFALDSIPAVFGLTSDPYIVFAVNAFALMGLRQLFFLLHGLLDRLVYLNRGLAVILGFIGLKLMLEGVGATTGLPVPHVSIALSLAVIVLVLLVTVALSLLAVRRDPSLLDSGPAAEAEREVIADAGLGLQAIAEVEDEQDRAEGDR